MSSAAREIPPSTLSDITVAAHGVVSATERLGDRIAAHAHGCPTEAGGACTCGTVDFANAMEALRSALLVLSPPKPGG